MFTLLQARLHWYMSQELPDVQAGFRNVRGTWDQIVNICWIIKKKQGNSIKKCLFCFIDYTKAFDYMGHNKLWKIFKEMGIPATPYLSPEKNLYAGQETTVRIRHGMTDWFKIGKGVCQGCILSPCLFNLHTKYIIWNARLYDSQAGIKIDKRNRNNIVYVDDTILMAGNEEELKSLLMNVKEESEKVGF